jgi:hypothetical protein
MIKALLITFLFPVFLFSQEEAKNQFIDFMGKHAAKMKKEIQNQVIYKIEFSFYNNYNDSMPSIHMDRYVKYDQNEVISVSDKSVEIYKDTLVAVVDFEDSNVLLSENRSKIFLNDPLGMDTLMNLLSESGNITHLKRQSFDIFTIEFSDNSPYKAAEYYFENGQFDQIILYSKRGILNEWENDDFSIPKLVVQFHSIKAIPLPLQAFKLDQVVANLAPLELTKPFDSFEVIDLRIH